MSGFEALKGLTLNREEIKEMTRGGITFGAHSVNHPVLARLSAREARKEICESKEMIASKIGSPVATFAYPFGKRSDYNQYIVKVVRGSGFKCAVTTEIGSNSYNTSVFELNRSAPWKLSLV